MQTQQVHGVSGGLMYTVKNTSVKASEGSFDELLQMQSTNEVDVIENTEKQPVTTKTKETSAEHVEGKEVSERTVESSEAEDAVTTDNGAVSDQKAESAEKTEEISDVEAAEKMTGLLNQIMDVVKDVLELSEEELNQFMEQLGITTTDLLNPVQLQELVLLVNNEQDAVSLITDAELLTTVNRLVNEVQQVLEQAGVTPEELISFMDSPEFDAMVEEAMSQMAEQTEATPEENVENEVQPVAEEAVQTESLENTEKTTTVEFKNENDTVVSQGAAEQKDVSRGEETTAENDTFAAQFTQNLQKAAEAVSEVTGEKDIAQMIREIADQILEKVKVTVTPETTSLEIVLTPEELGKVNLTVTEQDGVMKAKFVAENELAKEAIERNLVQFKEMLVEQGLKVESIEVAVGNFEFDKNGQAGQSGAQEEKKNGKHRFVNDDSIGQRDDTDQLARHFMEGGESTVNYMA